MADTDAGAGKGPILIKKYANRRLYNTESSSYVTLEQLAKLTRDGREWRVVDARTEEDLTRAVLAQIIMEEEGRGNTLLPAAFLRELIGMYGDSMQAVVPQYLEASLAAFRRNQAQFHQAMKGAFEGNPLADLAKRNMEMFEAATAALRPGGATGESASAPAEDPGEIETLKRQVAELQEKLAKLG